MNDVRFSPEGIRELGRAVAEPLRSGATQSAQHIAAAHGIVLPRIMGSGQEAINAMIRRAGEVPTLLHGMADAFQERMYSTADAYELVEAQNTGASAQIAQEA